MADINFYSAKFLTSAKNIHQCPPDFGTEVAFVGRSNAGKSSAINKLTNNKKLVFTSKTPGRTQLINFFELNQNPELRLVDLPGYGYAKVPEKIKKQWEKDLAQYLMERESLRGIILLMDIRHPMQPLDNMMIDWALGSNMPVHALLTKSDKLKRGPAKNTLLKIQKGFTDDGIESLVSGQTFSATSGEGVKELANKVSDWLKSGTRR